MWNKVSQPIALPMPTSKSFIFRVFIVRDQEVGGSNPLAPTNSFNTYKRQNHPTMRERANLGGWRRFVYRPNRAERSDRAGAAVTESGRRTRICDYEQANYCCSCSPSSSAHPEIVPVISPTSVVNTGLFEASTMTGTAVSV